MKAVHHAALVQQPPSEAQEEKLHFQTILDLCKDWLEEKTGVDFDGDGILGESTLTEDNISKIRPFLALDDDAKANRLRMQIKGKISQLSSGSFLAEDMGLPVAHATYIWGLTFEYVDRRYHQRKLRLLI